MGPGGDVARVAALPAGLPVDVPGLTVDRQCGSRARGRRRRPRAGAVTAAGSCSPAAWSPPRPHRAVLTRPGERAGTLRAAPFAPAALGDPDMGLAADVLAAKAGVVAGAAGRLRRPLARAGRGRPATPAASTPRWSPVGERTARRAAPDRPDRRAAGPAAARVPPRGRGRHGHRGQLVRRQRRRGRGHGRRRRHAPPAGCARAAGAGHRDRRRRPEPARASAWSPPPSRHWTSPASGSDDLDVVELNEAFAGQVLACCDALSPRPRAGLRRGRGARARAPVGCVRVRCWSSGCSPSWSRASRGRYGLAAIAVGGGQGVAMVVERCR